MKSCAEYLEKKLKLKVNREKSRVGSPIRIKFLGFALYKTGNKAGIRPHERSIKRFKARIKTITSRKRGFATMDYILAEFRFSAPRSWIFSRAFFRTGVWNDK